MYSRGHYLFQNSNPFLHSSLSTMMESLLYSAISQDPPLRNNYWKHEIGSMYTQRLGLQELVLSYPRKCLDVYTSWRRRGEEVGVSKLCGRDVHTETRNEGTSIEPS